MKENRNEIVEYLNKCPNCYSTELNNDNKPEIQNIEFHRVFEDTIILAVGNSEIKYFDCAGNGNIAIAIWDKIKGYQLKGHRMSTEDENKYCNEIGKFKNDLQANGIEMSKISLVFCCIMDIYDVSPGKFAGELVEFFYTQ